MDLLREILPSGGLVLLANLLDGLRTVLRWLENPGAPLAAPSTQQTRRDQQLRSVQAFPA